MKNKHKHNQTRLWIVLVVSLGLLSLISLPVLLHFGQGDILARYPGGTKKIAGHMLSGKYTGVIKEYYANGCLRSITRYESGQKKGLSTVYYLPEVHPSYPAQLKYLIKIRVLNTDIRGAVAQQLQFKNDQLNGLAKEFTPQGVLQRETMYQDGQRHGVDIVYASTKQKLQEFTYVYGKKHGQGKEYYSSGVKARLLNYSQGRQDGLQQSFYETGVLQSEQYFNKGTPVKTWTTYFDSGKVQSQKSFMDGDLNGIARYYYPTGVLRLEQPYVYGVHSGVDRQYLPSRELFMETPYRHNAINGIKKTYSDGAVIAAEQYEQDLQQGLSIYYRTGDRSIKEQTAYKYGRKNGQSLQFYRNGSVKMESNFVSGKLEGVVSKYYEKDAGAGNFFKALFNFFFGWIWPDTNKGQIEYEMPYSHDELEGTARIYYRSGMVHWAQTYRQGQLQGESKVYYESGTVMAMIPFKQGKEHGKAKAYYPSGNLMLEREYRNGQEISSKSFREHK